MIAFASQASTTDTDISWGTPSGYTLLNKTDSGTTSAHHAAYKIVASTAAVSASWTHDNVDQLSWAAALGTWKEAAAVGANPKGVFGLPLDGPLRRNVY